MKLIPPNGKSPSAQAVAERRPFPQVAVARRIDSGRPTRVWSLLLPPRFLDGGRGARRPLDGPAPQDLP
ncbi:MAG: hypothetical protein ABSG43_02095 [Solirubrobacteraceae bacterium]|jgi:hypothetical protein